MELIDILRILRRWLWLIIAVPLVAALVLWFRFRSAAPAYQASVEIQISTPQREEVPAYDQYRYVNSRDEVTTARNNFAEVLRSGQVREQTVDRLGLDGEDAAYTLEVDSARDADFIHVTVEARTPSLAAEIANAHVNAATTHYGLLRAMSTNAEKDLFAAELRQAEKRFHVAEDTFAEFRTQNDIFSLDDELETNQQLLEQLQLERDRHLLEETIKVAEPVAKVDTLIAQRQQELEQLLGLEPTYSALEENVRQARERYSRLLAQYDELEAEASSEIDAGILETTPITSNLTITATLRSTQTHTVKSGETLQEIASSLGVSAEALAAANNITQPSLIRSGQVLVVPVPETTLTRTPEGKLQQALLAAGEDLRVAEATLAEFKVANDLVSLEDALATHQKLLEQLQLERDRILLEETIQAPDPVAEVDKLIVQRQKELDRLMTLVPMNDILSEDVRQAREAYQHILSKYNEAELKATAVQAANFIQIVEPAQPPAQSASRSKQLFVLAVAGSLGLGVLLAFLLEYITGSRTVGTPTSGGEQETSSPRDHQVLLEGSDPSATTETETT